MSSTVVRLPAPERVLDAAANTPPASFSNITAIMSEVAVCSASDCIPAIQLVAEEERNKEPFSKSNTAVLDLEVETLSTTVPVTTEHAAEQTELPPTALSPTVAFEPLTTFTLFQNLSPAREFNSMTHRHLPSMFLKCQNIESTRFSILLFTLKTTVTPFLVISCENMFT